MRVGLVLAVLLAVTHAHAYPQFQLSTGSAQCSQCHVSPAGGGVLTAWGQSEAGDTIARGGNGAFLHGAVELPAWLIVGGDIRLAALANDTGDRDGVELAVFPMQLDLSLGVAFGSITVIGTIGARGRVRSGASDDPGNPATEVMEPTLASYIISREHYAMWRVDLQGPYVRAGRFATPYGLRLADHTAYVRRYLGFNLLDETYGIGGGYTGEAWELHATAFVHDPLQGSARRDAGAAVLVEAIASDRLILGGSARASIAAIDTRVQAGMHGKLWLDDAKLLVQAEVDVVRHLIDDGDRNQLVVYAGPVLVPARGINVGLAYQVFAEDLATRAVTRHAGDAWISVFPTAHVELMWSARAQWIGPGERALNSMLQVHYTL
jgi:hypothetical protein